MPELICPGCGKASQFHEDEVEDVRAGKALCVSCSIEEGYYVFMGEVLEGGHKELIKEMLEEQLQDE